MKEESGVGARTRLILSTLDVAAFEDPACFERYYAKMPAYRREKISRMRFWKNKALSLGAGALLSTALRDAGFWEDTLEIALGAYGKPFFPAIAGRFQFSLSHSGSRALCLVSVAQRKAPPVGCDVERRGEAQMRLAERFFAPEETKSLLALPTKAERDERFYQLWTLKESFIKCVGCGLNLPLADFSLRFEDNGGIALTQSIDAERYRLGLAALAPDVSAAWCAAGDGPEPELRFLTAGEDGLTQDSGAA